MIDSEPAASSAPAEREPPAPSARADRTSEIPRHPRGAVDLHLHTTVSDGRCTPRELVERAAGAGVSVLAVTDHDTVAGVPEVHALADARGMFAVAGIEITAVDEQRDVHILGYFLDAADLALGGFLASQRAIRIARIEAIGERLAALGMPVDLPPLVDETRRRPGRSLGRPMVARAMVAAGYVADTREAFDRWLGRGCPAFIPRAGAPSEDVIAILHRAGGIASLAHPGRTLIDARIEGLRDAGLDAIEVYHPDHDSAAVDRYLRMSATLGLLVTGGSDFHGDPAHGLEPGGAPLPHEHWQRLSARRARHARQ